MPPPLSRSGRIDLLLERVGALKFLSGPELMAARALSKPWVKVPNTSSLARPRVRSRHQAKWRMDDRRGNFEELRIASKNACVADALFRRTVAGICRDSHASAGLQNVLKSRIR
jgi:hypothetical protein